MVAQREWHAGVQGRRDGLVVTRKRVVNAVPERRFNLFRRDDVRLGRAVQQNPDTLAASTADVLIVRTQWLSGRHGTCFPRTMWERAVAGRPTKVVTDQVGRPTYATDLAAALWELIGLGTRGIVHVTNDGQATWFDVAARVFQRAGRPDLLAPCTTSEYPTAARRPAYSVLGTARFEREVGHPLRPWTAAIDAWLHTVAEQDPHPA